MSDLTGNITIPPENEPNNPDFVSEAVQYEMVSDLQRIKFTLGRTSIIVEGPADEADKGRILMESLKELFVQALENEGVTGDEEYELGDSDIDEEEDRG